MLCASLFFFFNDTATTEIYTLSLHDALPISSCGALAWRSTSPGRARTFTTRPSPSTGTCSTGRSSSSASSSSAGRSEEHTSELQSRQYLVCRLLLEKKKNITYHISNTHKKRI